MNNLLRKATKLLLGISLAAGVGVAIGNNNRGIISTDATSSVSGTYVKVTSATGISAGDTVIMVNTAGTKALTGISTTSTKYGTLADVTVSNNTITLTNADVEELTVETGYNSSGFSFKGTGDISGYLTWTSGNSLNSNATKSANTSWTLSASDGTLTIANNSTNTRLIRFNSDRFACYTTSTGTLAQLYKKGASLTKLATPTNVSATGSTISWTNVSNNSGYAYSINTSPATTGNLDQNTTSFDASTLSLNPGNYTFQIKAKGDGTSYSDSDYCTAVAFEIPDDGYDRDTFTVSDLAATTTSYTEFSVSGVSGATYVGWSAMPGSPNTGYMQFNNYSSPKNRSIATSVTGGYIKEISVTWGNDNGKEFSVYVSNTPYNSSSSGDTGTVQSSTLSSSNSKVTISGNYKYVSLYPNGAIYPASITFVWEPVSAYVTGVTVTGNMSTISYNTVQSWSNAGLTATASMSDSSSYGGEFSWAYSPLTPAAAVIANNGNEVTGLSVTATASAETESGSKSTSGISVSYATVAQGIAATPGTGTLSNAIVKGIVSQIDDISISYGNATYYISDDGSTTNQLKVYHGKYLSDASFTNVNQLEVGDNVVIYGGLTTYSSSPQFAADNYLLSLDRPASNNPSITITEAAFTMNLGDSDVSLHETHENMPEGGSIRWISGTPATATIGESTGVVHAVAVGTTEISAQILDDESNVVASNSITITVISCPIHIGDEIYFYAEYSSTTYYMAAVGQTSSSDEQDKVMFTVEAGNTNGSFSFKNGSNYLKCTSSSPYLGSSTEKDDTTSWIVADNGNDIIITSVSTTTRSVMWNYNNGSPRFGAYSSPNATILRVQIGLPVAPTYVTLNKSTLTLENGTSETLTYTTDQYVSFVWVSSAPAVATVDSTGSVECVANSGTAVIRIFYDTNKNGSYNDGEPTSTCTVTATPAVIHFADTNYGGVATRIESDSTGTSLDGKKVIFGCEDQEVVSGALDGVVMNYHSTAEEEFDVVYNSTNYTFTIGNGRADTHITVFTLHSISSGVYSISADISGNTKYLEETTVKKLAYSDEAYSWNVSISSGTATIQSTNGYLKYNHSSPRFTTYASGQDDVELYEYKSFYEEATEYAEYFVGGNTGTCADTINDWSDLGDMFGDLSTGAQNIYKIATHTAPETYSHEISVEHAVARYDDALLKHTELRSNEFMGRVSEGTLSYSSASSITVLGLKENTNTIAIIVIISMVSVTAIGGYFFIKRRKVN